MTDKSKYKSIIVTKDTHEAIKKVADKELRNISQTLKVMLIDYSKNHHNLTFEKVESEKGRDTNLSLNLFKSFNEGQIKKVLSLLSSNKLDERQMYILTKRLIAPDYYSFEVLAKEFKISKQRVEQIVTSSIDKIKKNIDAI